MAKIRYIMSRPRYEPHLSSALCGTLAGGKLLIGCHQNKLVYMSSILWRARSVMTT